MKVNSVGDTVFAVSYPATSEGYSLIKNFDGGYTIGGYLEINNPQYYLIRTDSVGDTLWTKSRDTNGYCLAQSPDSGYYAAGKILLKLDANGDSVWAKDIYSLYSIIANSVEASPDSGIVVTGVISSPAHIGVLKFNSVGDTIWTRNLGDGLGYSAKVLPDNSIIVASMSYDTATFLGTILLSKLNQSGDSIWSSMIGDSFDIYPREISLCADGGFIIAGYSTTFWSTDSTIFLLVRTDSMGTVKWKRFFSHGYNNLAESVSETLDGGFIASGWTGDVVTSLESDIYLIKTDQDGNLIWTNLEPGQINASQLIVSPNPTYGKCLLRHFSGVKSWEVFNMLGEKFDIGINRKQENETELDFTSAPAGIYFVRIQLPGEMQSLKVIKAE